MGMRRGMVMITADMLMGRTGNPYAGWYDGHTSLEFGCA